jgi:hypothetical protein
MISPLRYVAFFVIYFVSFQSLSQLGYLGKRFGVELGVASNFSLFNSRDFHNYEADEDILLPKFSIGVNRENKRGTVVHWRMMYNQLPNSQVSSLLSTPAGATVTTEIDSAWTKSNNLQFSIGYRKYRELSPLGLYFEFQFECNVVFNRSLLYSERLVEYPELNYFERTIGYKYIEETSFIPEIGLSLGSSYPLSNKFIIDYGGRLNITLGKFRDKGGNKDELPDSSTLHRILSSRKSFAHNFLEFYVNIILFP